MPKVYKTEDALRILNAFIEKKNVRYRRRGFKSWTKVNFIGEFNHQWNFQDYEYKIEKYIKPK